MRERADVDMELTQLLIHLQILNAHELAHAMHAVEARDLARLRREADHVHAERLALRRQRFGDHPDAENAERFRAEI